MKLYRWQGRELLFPAAKFGKRKLRLSTLVKGVNKKRGTLKRMVKRSDGTRKRENWIRLPKKKCRYIKKRRRERDGGK